MTAATGDGSAAGQFAFGLNEAQEQRAQRLHFESVIFDTLSQHAGGNIFANYPPNLQGEFQAATAKLTGIHGLMEVIYWPYEVSLRGQSDLIYEWYRQGGLTCGTYSIDVHDGHDPVMKAYDALVLRYAALPWLRYVTTAKEIRDAKTNGVIAFYAHCQPTGPVPEDLKAFDIAYAKGLRSFMLTYNRMNVIGVGCTERVDAGLSMFGIQVVEHCNALGMLIDVSHCGCLTTLDACKHSRAPVNANHTAARALSSHARAKSDAELIAIAGTGGVIGVVALPAFLSTDPAPTIDDMLNHIDYIADLVGVEHVALGTDHPQQAPDQILRRLFEPELTGLGFRKKDQLDVTKRLVGFNDCRDLPNITRGLVKRGYNDDEIRGILGENALRVFATVCG